MLTTPKIKSAMTPFPYSVDIKTPVMEALDFMREHGIRHLPVTEDGVLIGVVTDRDIKLLLGPEFEYPEPATTKVADAMVDEAYVVDLETKLDVVLDEMSKRKIGSVLVTRKGKIAGIFTSVDACRVFAEYLQSASKPTADDDAA